MRWAAARGLTGTANVLMMIDMEKHLWAIRLLALTSPIILAGVSIFLLGWPVRFPYPAAHFVILFWLMATGSIGFKWRRNNSSAVSVAVANRAFIGFSIGTLILGLVFLTPTVAEECGTVYYHYPVPAIDVWVEKIAERLDTGAC